MDNALLATQVTVLFAIWAITSTLMFVVLVL